MHITIRPAVAVDLTAVAAILDQAVSSKAFHGDLAWGDKAYDGRSLQSALDQGTLYVASADGDIVATFRLELADGAHWGAQAADAVYVQRFATAHGYRGQRLGSQIFDHIADLVLRSGRHYIRLVCPSKNGKLAAYHESNGFVRADQKAHPALASDIPIVYFERLVDPGYRPPFDSVQNTIKHGAKKKLFGRWR